MDAAVDVDERPVDGISRAAAPGAPLALPAPFGAPIVTGTATGGRGGTAGAALTASPRRP